MLTFLVINYRNDSEPEFLGKVNNGEEAFDCKTMKHQGNRKQNLNIHPN